MNVPVMDVEGTDGRELGEDQVMWPVFISTPKFTLSPCLPPWSPPSNQDLQRNPETSYLDFGTPRVQSTSVSPPHSSPVAL